MTRLKVILAVVVACIFALPSAPSVAADPKPEADIRSEDGKVLIAADQIRSYDWATHTLTLAPRARDELAKRLGKDQRLVSGIPFDVTIGGKVAYKGVFTTVNSSLAISKVVIVVDTQAVDATLGTDQLRIQLGYPGKDFFKGEDPRANPRVLESLTAGGKLSDSAPPEPGPEDGGLRLRLAVAPRPERGKEGYEVRVALLNTTERAITLRTGWRDDRVTGDVRSYLEAAASIESVPAIAPWIGGVQQGQRTLPQSEHVLKPGEVLTVDWRTEGPLLKNRVTDPNEVQNPRFPFPGLYSVHATVDVITAARTVRLRSNEQLVAVGGSRAMPKYTFSQLRSVEPEKRTAILGLGSLHKIAVGDQFEIGNAKSGHWKLTITRVEAGMSFGGLEMMTTFRPQPESSMPAPLMDATLIEQKR